MALDKKIASVVAVVGAVGINLLGGWDVIVYMVCMVMALDYFTGVMLAILRRKLSSSIGINGILKKVTILCMIALAVIVDNVLGETGAIRALVIMFYIGMEGLSVIENAVGLGVPVPDRMREVLIQLREDGKKAEPIVTTVNQEVVSITNGVTTETSRETVTSTIQKEE